MYRRRSNSRGSQGSKTDTLDQINQENNYSLANQKPQFGSQPTNKNSVVLLSGGSMHDRKSSFGSHQGGNNNQSYQDPINQQNQWLSGHGSQGTATLGGELTNASINSNS